MIFNPQGRNAHWPADYRCYAVELYRLYDAGKITIGEAECRLANRFEEWELPDERTLRRWAHDKYRNLPEEREQIFKPQQWWNLNYQPIPCGCYPTYGTSLMPVFQTQVGCFSSAWALMNHMMFWVVLGMLAAMLQTVHSSL